MNPLVKSGAEDGVGRDEIDGLNSGQACQQVEIGDMQAARIGNPVGNRDDNSADWRRHRLDEQPLPQHVLVAAAGIRRPTLVAAKCRGQESCLLKHPFGAAVEFGVAAQCLLEQLLETRDLLPLPSQLIVKAQHLRHESGTQLKGRAGGGELGRGLARGCLDEHVALVGREARGRVDQAAVQAIVELVAGDEIELPQSLASAAVLDQALQLSRRAGRWHDDERGREGFSTGESGKPLPTPSSLARATIASRKAWSSRTRTSLVRRGVITAVAADGRTTGFRSWPWR